MRNSELNKNWLISKNILNCHLKNKGKKFYCIGTMMNIIDKKIKNKCIENKSKIINLNFMQNKILFIDI